MKPGLAELLPHRIAVLVCIVLLGAIATPRDGWTAEPGEVNDYPFNFYRFNEDWSYLSDKQDLTTFEKSKYIALSDTNQKRYLSLGGHARTQFTAFDNNRYSLLGGGDGTKWLNRLLVHADLHVNDSVRAFAEIGTHQASVTDDIRQGPFDENDVDLHQAFVDLKHDNFTLRAGRQEFAVGSARLVSVRDGPNVRRSFYGAKLTANYSGVQASGFYFEEVEVESGSFDDRRNGDEELWGVYTTWRDVGGLTDLDVYYLGTDRAVEQYVQGVGRDERHSVGFRVFGDHERWFWNHEALYQFGDFEDADISAWTLATITGYSFKEARYKPRIYLRAAIASGDDDPDDDDLETFNPLFPNLFYFEEAAILSPQNFMNLQPGISVSMSPRVTLALDWNFFWKHREEDAVYTGGLFPLPGTADSDGRFVSHNPQLSLDWNINPFLELDLRYAHFFAGEVIDDAGGDDVDFFMAELTLRF